MFSGGLIPSIKLTNLKYLHGINNYRPSHSLISFSLYSILKKRREREGRKKRGKRTFSQTMIKFQNPIIDTSIGPKSTHQSPGESLIATTYILCNTNSIVPKLVKNLKPYRRIEEMEVSSSDSDEEEEGTSWER